MTLTDTTAAHDAHVDTPAATQAEPAKQTKARETKSAISGTVLTVTDATGTHDYDTATLPPISGDYARAVGVRALLANTDDPAARWAELLAGTHTGRTIKAEKPLDHKRQAIANALVEYTKKSETPVTLAEAEARARGMSRIEVEREMLQPLVVKHFGKIEAPKSSLFGAQA